MSTEPTLTPPVPPIVRILRTLVQLLVAFPLLVPALVELAHAVGIEKIDQPALLVIAAAALAFVVAVQNFLERAGIIPTLGANTAAAANAHNALVATTLARVASGEIPPDVIGGLAQANAERAEAAS